MKNIKIILLSLGLLGAAQSMVASMDQLMIAAGITVGISSFLASGTYDKTHSVPYAVLAGLAMPVYLGLCWADGVWERRTAAKRKQAQRAREEAEWQRELIVNAHRRVAGSASSASIGSSTE
jgi:hypothetical protein